MKPFLKSQIHYLNYILWRSISFKLLEICVIACHVGCLLTPFCEQTVIDSLLNETVVVLVNIQ